MAYYKMKLTLVGKYVRQELFSDLDMHYRQCKMFKQNKKNPYQPILILVLNRNHIYFHLAIFGNIMHSYTISYQAGHSISVSMDSQYF